MIKSDSSLLRILASLTSLARQRGLLFALRAAAWRVQTALQKARIRLEDRLGWYPYARWVQDFETPNHPPPLVSFTSPRFSVLVHYSEYAQGDLSQTIRSLLAQTYPNWEAHLVLDRVDTSHPPAWPAASEPRFMPIPEKYPTRVLEAVVSARSEFILALSGGDTLSPNALAEFARWLEADPGLEILYSDEDNLADDGITRRAPFFKPDWSPELMYSVNFILRAVFRRSALLEKPPDVHPAVIPNYQDLIFRLIDQPRRVAHIPEVLIHCAPGVDYLDDGAEHWYFSRLHAFLKRKGLESITISHDRQGETSLRWKAEPRLVSIIIPTRDQVEYLRRCIESIRTTVLSTPFEIVLVETGSQEPATFEYYETLRAAAGVHFVNYSGEFNFSAALNLGARHAAGDLFLFLNNDTEACDVGWLSDLAQWALLPDVGIVGGRLLYPDGTIQHAGIVVGMEGHASHVYGGLPADHYGLWGSPGWYRNVSAVTGACMMMRREVFASLGGFDEAYRLVFSDIEICLRAWQRGLRVVYTPQARLIHHEGRTRYRYMPLVDIHLGRRHFQQVVERGDPFYNRNLSLAVRTPTLRRPWEPPASQRLEEIADYFWPEP